MGLFLVVGCKLPDRRIRRIYGGPYIPQTYININYEDVTRALRIRNFAAARMCILREFSRILSELLCILREFFAPRLKTPIFQ